MFILIWLRAVQERAPALAPSTTWRWTPGGCPCGRAVGFVTPLVGASSISRWRSVLAFLLCRTG